MWTTLCAPGRHELTWLFDSLTKQCHLKRYMLEPGSRKEVNCLSRLLRRVEYWIEWECEPKHTNVLIREYGTWCRLQREGDSRDKRMDRIKRG